MKKKSPLTATFAPETVCAGIISLACFSLAAPSVAQVKIEAGPGKVQISDEDGRTEPAQAGTGEPITAEVPIGVVPVREPGPTIIRPVPNSDVTVIVPDKPVEEKDPITPGVVTATAVVVPPKAEVQPQEIKEMTKIEREMNIARSATMAKVSLVSDDLFREDGPELTTFAESTLSPLVRYMELLDGESATITYHFVAERESSSEAREKATQLALWLKAKEEIKDYGLLVPEPKLVTKPIPQSGTSGAALTQYEPFVEIQIDR